MPESLTESYYVESFKDLPESEVGQVLLMKSTTGSDHGIRRTDRGERWCSVVVVHKSCGGGRPYQDSSDTYEVTFSGGTPAATRGWELPSATRPPYEPMGNHVVYSSHTDDERRIMHDDRIKAIIRTLTREWATDSTKGEKRVVGGTWLSDFTCIGTESFSTTYCVTIVTPNMS